MSCCNKDCFTYHYNKDSSSKGLFFLIVVIFIIIVLFIAYILVKLFSYFCKYRSTSRRRSKTNGPMKSVIVYEEPKILPAQVQLHKSKLPAYHEVCPNSQENENLVNSNGPESEWKDYEPPRYSQISLISSN